MDFLSRTLSRGWAHFFCERRVDGRGGQWPESKCSPEEVGNTTAAASTSKHVLKRCSRRCCPLSLPHELLLWSQACFLFFFTLFLVRPSPCRVYKLLRAEKVAWIHISNLNFVSIKTLRNIIVTERWNWPINRHKHGQSQNWQLLPLTHFSELMPSQARPLGGGGSWATGTRVGFGLGHSINSTGDSN